MHEKQVTSHIETKSKLDWSSVRWKCIIQKPLSAFKWFAVSNMHKHKLNHKLKVKSVIQEKRDCNMKSLCQYKFKLKTTIFMLQPKYLIASVLEKNIAQFQTSPLNFLFQGLPMKGTNYKRRYGLESLDILLQPYWLS